MSSTGQREVLKDILARADLDAFTERVLDSFWDSPELRRLGPPRGEVRGWVRWNIDLVVKWLVGEQGLTDSELELFREQARARAADGTPPDFVPANFRRAARFAWAALLEGAREEERLALLESADLLFEYVDRVSRVFSEVYESAQLQSDEEGARALLARIGRDEPPHGDDHRLAEAIGFELERSARPFVIALPDGTAQDHAKLAGAMRAAGALAAAEGRRVAGLSQASTPWRTLGVDSGAVIAAGGAAIRHERGRALDELRLVVEAALARGRSGVQNADQLLPELLLLRSPRLARHLQRRVYGPLDVELARTLDTLIQHDFERSATAEAIPVHRNTLRDRLARITELTGVDLATAQGGATAWLAWLSRRLAV